MYIDIQNANIQLNTNGMPNSVSGDTHLMISNLFEVTDADMCIDRVRDPEAFAFTLVEYSKIRIECAPGKYSNKGIDGKAYILSDSQNLAQWANQTMWNAYPEYSGATIESVMLYAGGSFKLMCIHYPPM